MKEFETFYMLLKIKYYEMSKRKISYIIMMNIWTAFYELNWEFANGKGRSLFCSTSLFQNKCHLRTENNKGFIRTLVLQFLSQKLTYFSYTYQYSNTLLCWPLTYDNPTVNTCFSFWSHQFNGQGFFNVIEYERILSYTIGYFILIKFSEREVIWCYSLAFIKLEDHRERTCSIHLVHFI